MNNNWCRWLPGRTSARQSRASECSPILYQTQLLLEILPHSSSLLTAATALLFAYTFLNPKVINTGPVPLLQLKMPWLSTILAHAPIVPKAAAVPTSLTGWAATTYQLFSARYVRRCRIRDRSWHRNSVRVPPSMICYYCGFSCSTQQTCYDCCLLYVKENAEASFEIPAFITSDAIGEWSQLV